MKSHVELALKRAAEIAARHGVASAPLRESEHLIWQKFDGNVFPIQQTIAYYDEHDDEIVFNHGHRAWKDMRAFVQSRDRRGVFSTTSADHFIRHEIGHALHYRCMTNAERVEIWYKELTAEEEAVAVKVSEYAIAGRAEFVAEVYAGLWARRRFAPQVLSSYEKLR